MKLNKATTAGLLEMSDNELQYVGILELDISDKIKSHPLVQQLPDTDPLLYLIDGKYALFACSLVRLVRNQIVYDFKEGEVCVFALNNKYKIVSLRHGVVLNWLTATHSDFEEYGTSSPITVEEFMDNSHTQSRISTIRANLNPAFGCEVRKAGLAALDDTAHDNRVHTTPVPASEIWSFGFIREVKRMLNNTAYPKRAPSIFSREEDNLVSKAIDLHATSCVKHIDPSDIMYSLWCHININAYVDCVVPTQEDIDTAYRLIAKAHEAGEL